MSARKLGKTMRKFNLKNFASKIWSPQGQDLKTFIGTLCRRYFFDHEIRNV